MSRRRTRSIPDLPAVAAALPWWVSACLAVLSFVLLRRLAGGEAAAPSDLQDMGAGLLQQVLLAAARIGQFVLPLVFAFAAAISIGRGLKRARLFETFDAPPGEGAPVGGEPSAPSGGALSWREVETLVGDVYRARGYRIEQTAPDGDGGVDFVLRRGDDRYFVQCKRWRNGAVDADVVRELDGVLAEASVQGGAAVSSGPFTVARMPSRAADSSPSRRSRA